MLRAVTAAMGMAIVNGQRFAEVWTYGRPEKRPALLRLVVETMRGQERVCSRFRCTRAHAERKNVATDRDVWGALESWPCGRRSETRSACTECETEDVPSGTDAMNQDTSEKTPRQAS